MLKLKKNNSGAKRLILCSHLHEDLPSGLSLSPSGFPIKILHAPVETWRMVYQRICPILKQLWTVHNMAVCYCEELSAHLQTRTPKNHPLSAVRDSLFSIFAAPYLRPLLHLQPEEVPYHCDRDPLNMHEDIPHRKQYADQSSKPGQTRIRKKSAT